VRPAVSSRSRFSQVAERPQLAAEGAVRLEDAGVPARLGRPGDGVEPAGDGLLDERVEVDGPDVCSLLRQLCQGVVRGVGFAVAEDGRQPGDHVDTAAGEREHERLRRHVGGVGPVRIQQQSAQDGSPERLEHRQARRHRTGRARAHEDEEVLCRQGHVRPFREGTGAPRPRRAVALDLFHTAVPTSSTVSRMVTQPT
jgi:hypothetical protein